MINHLLSSVTYNSDNSSSCHTFRPTRDLDLLTYGENSPEAIRETFRAILTQRVDDDDVIFDVDRLEAASIREDLDYGEVG